MDIQLEYLKEIYLISDAWRDEGFEGEPKACCKSPFRNDRKSSFSVFGEGRFWRDFATGESGDVFSFVEKARNCTFAEALKVIRQKTNCRNGNFGIPVKKRQKSANSAKIAAIPRKKAFSFSPIPKDLEQKWHQGISALANLPEKQKEIENWRNWPKGIVRKLLENGFLSLQVLRNSPKLAFPVFSPKGIQLGFHVRNSKSGNWFFLPNSKSHGKSTKPFPFILGSGFLPTAKVLVVLEGQWDCISFAAWSGWLDSDTSWPDGVAIVGIRGASNWRMLLEFYSWPSDASIALIPDNDEAGLKWKGEFLNQLKLRSRKVVVFVPKENDLSDQLAVTENKQALLHAIMERTVA